MPCTLSLAERIVEGRSGKRRPRSRCRKRGCQNRCQNPPGYESDDSENRNLMPHPDLCVSSCFAETNRNQHAQHVEHDVGKMLDVLFTLVKAAGPIDNCQPRPQTSRLTPGLKSRADPGRTLGLHARTRGLTTATRGSQQRPITCGPQNGRMLLYARLPWYFTRLVESRQPNRRCPIFSLDRSPC